MLVTRSVPVFIEIELTASSKKSKNDIANFYVLLFMPYLIN